MSEPTDTTYPFAEDDEPRAEPTVLCGRYRLGQVVGSGAMAFVYRALDLQTGETVAIKVLRRERADARQVERLAVEAVTMRFLAHPNVPAILEMARDELTGLYFVVMEFAERGSAFEAVRAHGALPGDVVAGWMIEVLAALAAAHARGIVHRDVKPANILIRRDGRAMLTDFGIVRTPEGELTVERGAAVGTPSYMPPEQRLAADEVLPESDVYAVGATMYVLLTAQPPGGLMDAAADDPRWNRLPEALRPIVYRATRRSVRDRWPDARALARALAPHARPGLWAAEPHLATWLEG